MENDGEQSGILKDGVAAVGELIKAAGNIGDSAVTITETVIYFFTFSSC